MKYIIMQTTTDTTTGNKMREYSAPVYASAQDAHNAAKAANMRDYRVFPDTSDISGIDAMARSMTRTACKLLLEKTSGDNVNALNLLNRIRAATYAQTMTDHDALDCVGAATSETWAAIVDQAEIFDQAARGLSAVYRHIRGERAYFNGRREKLLHLDSMTDADVAYWGAILDDIADDIVQDEETRKPRDNAPCLMDCVNERLTDTQRAVVLLMTEGMTQAQIARVLDRSASTVTRHVKLARATLAAYMQEKGIPVPDGVTDDDIAALIQAERDGANADKRRTAEGAERARASRAESMRKLRERRKAEKAARVVSEMRDTLNSNLDGVCDKAKQGDERANAILTAIFE